MIVTVNGSERTLADETTVLGLVRELGVPENGRGVAVALDAEVVPRSDWEQTALYPGARIEVLVAVQGG